MKTAFVAFAMSILLSSTLLTEAHAAGASCKALKSSLFSKPTVDIRMVFGYKDARPARFVGDRHERLAFIERISEKCEAGNQACGFSRSPDDADLFTKTVFISGRAKTVRLLVVNSSVGSDDEENLSDPFQAWKSKNAQRTFLDGLRDADIVFYNGHSRFGGGPDFTSPKLAKDGTIEVAGYQSKKRGLKKLLGSLEEARRPKRAAYSGLKVLGMFSCSSSQHFNSRIRSSSDAALISSDVLMYYSDALDQSLSAMSSLLREQCPKALIL